MALMTDKELQLLGATSGAYSVVTEREAVGDRSVTLDIDEKFVLSRKVNLNSIVRRGGAVDTRPERVWFFVINPQGFLNLSSLDIPLVYPKSSGNELRLYMQGSRGFFGNTGDYFIILCRPCDEYPIVGFIPSAKWEEFWDNLSQVPEVVTTLASQDIEDFAYQQDLMASQAGVLVQQTRNVYNRDPSVAKAAIERSKFRCEVNPAHQTFLSPVTNHAFMEAHHLIPMSQQACFSCSLDQIFNVVSLCPCCHRAIHLGGSLTRREMLRCLFLEREKDLEKIGVNFERLCSFYEVKS